MRDGSLDDVVGTWIERIVEEHGGRNPGDNEAAVYFALLKRAIVGLLETHARFEPITNFRAELVELLSSVRDGLGEPAQAVPVTNKNPDLDWREMEASPIEPDQPSAEKHANYWASDSWKKDFYTGFSCWFWDMKDYANAAGRRKSDFLWDVAEVWIATAASAMVYYAKDDRQRWFETAQMLRHYADLTEKDGLRSLPWGRWGRYSKKNHRPKV